MTGKCFVPGCRSGLDSVRRQYKKEKKKHPQIFGAPKNWTMLQIWSHAIPKLDKKFSITDRVCELHFTEDYIAKFHDLTLKDGKAFKLERKYARLKPGAIPTVFPDLPHYSKILQKIVDQMHVEFPLHVSEMHVKIDEQMENYFKLISEVQEIAVSNSEDEIQGEENNSNKSINVHSENLNADEINFCSDESDSSTEDRKECDVAFNIPDEDLDINTKNLNSEPEDIETEDESESDEITFSVLVKNLNAISKPSTSWSITAHGKFVICAKWNKEYIPEKRIVIDRDLNIKVFVNDNEIAAYNNLCISDISDISNILRILDK